MKTLDDFISELEEIELDDTESATTDFMCGYYCGCRDTKIQLAAQLRFLLENTKDD